MLKLILKIIAPIVLVSYIPPVFVYISKLIKPIIRIKEEVAKSFVVQIFSVNNPYAENK